MFELIGICVVVYLVWRIAKRVSSTAVRKTLSEAIIYANKQGVPRDFSVAVTETPNALREARKILKENNPDVATLDVYQQYGLAITMLYERNQERESAQKLPIVKKVIKDFLQPQIDRLHSQGLRTHMNDVVLAYILTMATAVTKSAGTNSINFAELKEIAASIFPTPEHLALIENAFDTINFNPNEFIEKCNALTPIIMDEVKNNKGEYYEKYTKKAIAEIDDMFNRSIDYDPRKVKKHNFLDV